MLRVQAKAPLPHEVLITGAAADKDALLESLRKGGAQAGQQGAAEDDGDEVKDSKARRSKRRGESLAMTVQALFPLGVTLSLLSEAMDETVLCGTSLPLV